LPESVAWLLHPAKEVIGFFGRGWVLRQLETWCADPAAAAVRLVIAPGGYGKTRLARQLCVRVSGWTAWWVTDGGEAGAIDAIASDLAPDRLLVVVDYADARQPAALAGLLVAAASRKHLRVLLLARTAGPWWTSLSASYPAQAALVDGLVVPNNVIALSARVDDREPELIVTAAVGEFAEHLRYAVPHGFRPRRHDPDTPLLRLHAEALLAVLGGSRSANDRYDVLREVLSHEARYWRGCARRAGLALPAHAPRAEALLRQLVGVAALLGARDRAEIDGIVRRVPLAEAIEPTALSDWGDWLTDLYPTEDTGTDAGSLGTLRPDLLAEHLAVDVLRDCTATQLSVIFSGLSIDQATHALTVLGRATQDHHPAASALINSALVTDLETMAYGVLGIARQFPGTFTPRLTEMLTSADLDLDRLRALAEGVHYPSRELGPLALTLTTRIVNQDTQDSTAIRATWRSWHAVWLAGAGRRAEALATSEEAVRLRRELVAGNRDAYLPNLATSVNNHANRLAELGRRVEALEVSEEAVGFYRELVASNRDAYLPDLATAVNNHALRLAESGRRPEALATSDEAVRSRRELVAGNRDAYLPNLATSVSNHANRLAESGRRVEALATSEEAVDFYRELVASNRDAYLPNLATSVNNHALRLAESSRRPEALEVSEEAVRLRRELVAGNRDAYLPDLARSVNNHAARLAESGRRAEALATSEEAVGFYRELVAGNRDGHLPELATSLWMTASVCLTVEGPMDHALEAAQEAVTYLKDLAGENPDAFTDQLLAAAAVLAKVHGVRGEPEAAARVRAQFAE
jgi:tetratricopeptide (TPR) repeat protein